jgi:hypothetical protein
MAMSYESDVTVTDASGGSKPFRIYMNNPYHGAGWKVYQSGFSMEEGEVSIFSVMKDPGLPLTYIGAIGLVGGILITFYSRGMSWGHPGIPVAFTESSHGPSAPRPQSPAVALAGVGASPAVDGPARLDPGAGRRPDDAAGLVRAAAGGPAHR